MFPMLPELQKPQIKQTFEPPKTRTLSSLDGLLLILPRLQDSKIAWPDFPHSALLKKRYQSRTDKNAPWLTQLPDERGTPVAIGFADDTDDIFATLTLARKLTALLMPAAPRKVGVMLPGLADKLALQMAEATLAALLAADFKLPAVKSTPQTDNKHLSHIHLLGLPEKMDTRRTQAAALGNNLARWLTALPGNALTPASYRQRVKKLATEYGWKYEFLDQETLKKRKAGAFLAVCQASATRDAGIVHLKYTPSSKSKRNAGSIALVGKGICYDTGGTNLKPAGGMFGMHGDMQGSAVALGTFLALSELKVNFPMECWLALAENHTGPKAYKPNDVITASNGTTIEIVHTDAEGRMVLSDTLALAARNKPAAIMDFATLTGTCVASLGTRYSGAFTNKIELTDKIIQAGRDSGERVWPFPNDDDYTSELDSEVADIKQCLIPGAADHILASKFLSRFVERPANSKTKGKTNSKTNNKSNSNTNWVHIDLSAGEHKGGLAHVPTEVTGFGVRYSLSLLLDHKLGSIK